MSQEPPGERALAGGDHSGFPHLHSGKDDTCFLRAPDGRKGPVSELETLRQRKLGGAGAQSTYLD